MIRMRISPLILLGLLWSGCGPSPGIDPSSQTGAAAEAGSLMPLSTEAITHRLAPSVVRIQTDTAAPEPENAYFSEFGSGLIIDSSGHIITNNHVITTSDGEQLPGRITVTLWDRRVLAAKVIGRDRATDLAVIKIDASDLTPASFGNSDNLEVGQEVIALGFAIERPLTPIATRGVINGTHRAIRKEGYTIPDVIQTDAGINTGVSGGPLVDAQGQIVGLNTAIIQGAPSIGFAMPGNFIKPLLQNLVLQGRISRAYLGVGTERVTTGMARRLALPGGRGIAVTLVAEGSPAQQGDLKQDDVIVEIGERAVRNNGDLLAILADHKAGDRVVVNYYRQDKLHSTSITLGQARR
jgi:putative serine protease PepD